MDHSFAAAELDRHQAAILASLDAARRRIAAGQAAHDDLAHRRWELVRMLRGYQLCKQMRVFDPVLRRGQPAERATAAIMRDRCQEAGRAFERYACRWGRIDLAAHWDEYVAAMLQTSDAIRDHIARERRELPALLAVATRRSA